MYDEKKKEMQLSNKYRPRTMKEILGAKEMTRILLGYAVRGRMPRTIMLLGPPGVGKTTTARVIAAVLHCPHSTPDGDCCGRCETCNGILSGSHLGLFTIDAAANGGVEYARHIRLAIYGHYGFTNAQVVFFDEVHRLSPESMDVYLDPWEEPPEGMVSVLATTEEAMMPATVMSRCMKFYLGSLGADVLVPHLRHICDLEGIEAGGDLLVAIWARTGGNPREAIGLLDMCWTAGITRAADLAPEAEENGRDLASDMLAAIVGFDEVGIKAAVKMAGESGRCASVGRVQAVVATSSVNFSDGVMYPRVLRGRSLRLRWMRRSSAELSLDRSVPLGMYWRRRPLVFSFDPRCHGACGSQK